MTKNAIRRDDYIVHNFISFIFHKLHVQGHPLLLCENGKFYISNHNLQSQHFGNGSQLEPTLLQHGKADLLVPLLVSLSAHLTCFDIFSRILNILFKISL